MIIWDKTKASTPHRNLAVSDHICDTQEARLYRPTESEMKQAQAAQQQRAYEAWKKERNRK